MRNDFFGQVTVIFRLGARGGRVTATAARRFAAGALPAPFGHLEVVLFLLLFLLLLERDVALALKKIMF